MISKSLALLSDSIHVAFDLNGIIIAIFVEYCIRLHPKDEKRKNSIRSGGGIISSIFLFIMVAIILKTAIDKMIAPDLIKSDKIIIFSIIGLFGNAISLWLVELSEEKHITHIALSAHIISDLIQSVGVVIVGFVIFLTNWQVLDSISSFIMSILLLRISVNTLIKSWKSR